MGKESPSGKARLGGTHGLGLLVSDKVRRFVGVVDPRIDSPHVLFIKVSEEAFGIPFLLGSVYIPCESSIHYDNGWSDDLSISILSLISIFDIPLILMGDFNARTGHLEDFASQDDVEANECGYIPDRDIPSDCREDLERMGLSPERYNRDGHVNSNGRSLIQLCQALNLKILNGRCGSDCGVGDFTCQTARGKSVVDYVIASSALLPLIADFELEVFDSCLSDAHRPLCMRMFNFLNQGEDIDDSITENDVDSQYLDNSSVPGTRHRKVVWQTGLRESFRAAFSESEMDALDVVLRVVETRNQEAIDQNQIETISGLANLIFLTASQEVGMTRTFDSKKSRPHKKNENKAWFNEECNEQRKTYLRCKRRVKKHKTLENIQHLQAAAKDYKTFIRQTSRRYYKAMHASLRQMKSSDPKAYWDFINKNSTGITKSGEIGASLDALFEHFSGMNVPPRNAEGTERMDIATDNDEQIQQQNALEPDCMNKPFTIAEVKQGLLCLKNNKAPGVDGIINELLKNCAPRMIPLLTRWFNVILESGMVPENWCIGVITPIYKGKGSRSEPDNYRGITLLSCIGKLFTHLINKRLTEFVETHEIIGPEQAGFRQGFSTMDHIFTLHCIIAYYLHHRKRLFAAFLDYKKAFDLVDRNFLWFKLLNQGINGKVLGVVRGIYRQAKSCIRAGGSTSDYFVSNVGVRQGENLSPLLFSLFINDFALTFNDACDGLPMLSDRLRQDIDVLFPLYVLNSSVRRAVPWTSDP